MAVPCARLKVPISARMNPPEYVSDHARRRSGSNPNLSEDGEGTGGGIQGHLTQMVFEAGRSQVRQAFDSYGRIDLFRPYFDVEPKKVRARLLQSLLPRKPSSMHAATDLYGPLMLILTLVALLLFSMKASGFTLQDGTLIGTAMVTVFAYWTLASTGVAALAYVFNTDVPVIQIFSMVGYALFGHCVVTLLTATFHPVHSHLFFYALTVLLVFPSAARISIYLAYKTKDKTHKLIIGGFAAFLHISFLLYLHFGFHATIEEIEQVIHTNEIEGLMGDSSHFGIPATEAIMSGKMLPPVGGT